MKMGGNQTDMTPQYSFADEPHTGWQSRNGLKKKSRFNYQLDPSADDVNDGHSLTYSASSTHSTSSSQAGESTDSSIVDVSLLVDNPVQNEQKIFNQEISNSRANNSHQQYQQRRIVSHIRMNSIGTEISSVADSMDYSRDTDIDSFTGDQAMLAGQTSDSYIDGRMKWAAATNYNDTKNHRNLSVRTSSSPSFKKVSYSPSRRSLKSPATVITDATSSVHSGTIPSSPPPRHDKKMSDGKEFWYAKWWMCGFTDALNLNSS